jgi:hydrogenase nickel incorporation protein HypA/HybF
MHELSIAVSLVEIACQEAAQAGAEKVGRVYLKVGAFAGVVRDALTFAFDIATEGTMLEGATLVIEDSPMVVYCAACRAEKEPPDLYRLCCPECGAPTPEVRRGRELELTALELF